MQSLHKNAKMYRLIFGDNSNIVLAKKIHIMMTFLLMIIIMIGFVSNIIIGMNYLSNVANGLGLCTAAYFYFQARNSKDFYRTVPAFFVVSLLLLSFAWISNAGYDGNIPFLMMVCFLATYIVVRQSMRLIVLFSYVLMFVVLSLVQHYNLIGIVSYDNMTQRMVDIAVGGVLYIFFMYYLVDIIITTYTKENTMLENVNAERNKLFSIISHDLKNPLASLRDMTRVMSSEYDSFNDNERKELLSDMRESTEQVYELLENLLDWSRSQSGRVQITPVVFSLFSLVDNCKDLLQLMASKKGIFIRNEIQNTDVLYADPSMLHAVMRNIITNAIKFSHTGGIIRIYSFQSHDGDETVIAVQDSGTGIAEEKIGALFSIQSHSSQRGTAGEHGTGLGLVLCREFIEKHHGRIWVESTLGKGATFYFSLPNISTKSSY